MHSVAGKKTSVCAVLVTYHPAEEVVENARLLSMQCTKVVVIDNGSPASFSHVLSQIQSFQNVSLVRNPLNSGIAAALNQGVRHAQDSRFDWVATFDQDSSITPEYIRNMLEAYESCSFRDKVALIAPKYCANTIEWNLRKNAGNEGSYRSVQTAITSGNLIKTGVFKIAGNFDEPLFIDYVDFDFCLRLRMKGYLILESTRTFLLHQLGTSETRSFMGISLSIKSHNAIRYYYIMRNRVTMYRRWGLRFPLWTVNDMMWLGLDLMKIILFEKGKSAKLGNTIKGIRDGLTGILGALSPSSAATS